jgi:hypothetical protein
MYWGQRNTESAAEVFASPMEVATGKRVALPEVLPGYGVLLKEMTFQMGVDEFSTLTSMATAPVVFAIRNPVLCAASRLRVVRELSGERTFPPFESGWQSLAEQVSACRSHGTPYVLLDSDDLRTAPDDMAAALFKAVGLTKPPDACSWQPRPGLHLCAPEVGSLMGSIRATDDPFFRRVLSSNGIQPPDFTDLFEEHALIETAGLEKHVAEWSQLHNQLRKDPNFLTVS